VSENFYGYAQEVKDTETDLLAAEERVLGVSHAEVGGRLLEHWQFPENLIQAARFHHRPVAAPKYQRLAAFLNLGNTIAYNLNRAYGHQRSNPDLTIETTNLLGLSADVLADYSSRVAEKLARGDSYAACMQAESGR
jgi:HD-like signal output (HDOD) protein